MRSNRRRGFPWWALACVPLAGPGVAQVAEPPIYGELVEVRTGFVRFLVPESAPAPRAEELEVLDGRTAQRNLRVVGGGSDSLEVAVAVDLTPSFRASFAPLRSAALALARDALGDTDRLLAVGFGGRASLLAEGRGEAMRVLEMLPDEPVPASGGTAFFDAVDDTLDMFANADPRAALIVVSDGCNSVPTLLDATEVARRARELSIPIFLLLPSREPCRRDLCARNVAGEWRCSSDPADAAGRRASSDTYDNAIVRTRMRTAERSTAWEATSQRDRFAALIEEAGGGAFVVGGAAEWPSTLREIFDRLSRQWTVVFEPSSETVRSDEVRVYARIDGKRRRLH